MEIIKLLLCGRETKPSNAFHSTNNRTYSKTTRYKSAKTQANTESVLTHWNVSESAKVHDRLSEPASESSWKSQGSFNFKPTKPEVLNTWPQNKSCQKSSLLKSFAFITFMGLISNLPGTMAVRNKPGFEPGYRKDRGSYSESELVAQEDLMMADSPFSAEMFEEGIRYAFVIFAISSRSCKTCKVIRFLGIQYCSFRFVI